jgi:hypothetical protein
MITLLECTYRVDLFDADISQLGESDLWGKGLKKNGSVGVGGWGGGQMTQNVTVGEG